MALNLESGELTKRVEPLFTLNETHVGVTIVVAYPNTVLSLPKTTNGFKYKILAASNNCSFSIVPQPEDCIRGGLIASGEDGKLLKNLSGKQNDMLELVADGIDGWFIHKQVGTFA